MLAQQHRSFSLKHGAEQPYSRSCCRKELGCIVVIFLCFSTPQTCLRKILFVDAAFSPFLWLAAGRGCHTSPFSSLLLSPLYPLTFRVNINHAVALTSHDHSSPIWDSKENERSLISPYFLCGSIGPKHTCTKVLMQQQLDFKHAFQMVIEMHN